MENPFDVLLREIADIKQIVADKPQLTASEKVEIIDTEELCRRLDISRPTAILWRKKGKIPYLEIGSAIRFNWHKVVASLEKANK